MFPEAPEPVGTRVVRSGIDEANRRSDQHDKSREDELDSSFHQSSFKQNDGAESLGALAASTLQLNVLR